MAKVTVTINELICKGCGLCVRACPKNVLALSKTKLNAKATIRQNSQGRKTASAALPAQEPARM